MDETDLLAKIREGDDVTFRQLYIELRSELVQWVMQNSSCGEQTAADIFQDCILVAYQNAANGQLTELRSTFKTYLYGIAKNKISEHSRRFGREHPGLDDKTDSVEVITTDYHSFPAEEVMALQEALKTLGGQCQRLLELFYFNGLDMLAISRLLGYKNTNSVKTQKYKCLGRLRKIMLKKPTQ